MSLIELENYTLKPEGTGNGLFDLNFSLSKGDSYSIDTDSTDDATVFLKALATLVSPVKGMYFFNGKHINLLDYRNALPCKKRIAYIAPDSALINNRTIRENLLFMRYFHEDTLSLSLDDNTADLCRRFDIYDKLDHKPGELHTRNIQNIIVIRELCKSPEVILLERPEDFVDHTNFDFFVEVIKGLTRAKLPLVFYSSDADFVKTFSNRKIIISESKLTTASL
jgi:ABC-type lipoprotein export system ATPase subunit